MAKKIVPFLINIGDSGESQVEYPVTEKERKAILNAIEDGDLFGEVEQLEDLYDRVMAAAKDKLEEDLDLTGDDADVYDLDYSVDFCDEEDYE